jgi:hypothetical protein
MSARAWLCFPLLGLALLLACPRPGLARQPRRTPFTEDTHVFRRILFDFKFTALKDVRQQQFDTDPADTVIVILGDTTWIPQQGSGWLPGFVEKGGALLFATDRKPGPEVERELIEVAGVTVVGRSVRCWDPGTCYRGLDYCPLLRPAAGARPALFRDPRPRQGENPALQVATNAPSYLHRHGAPAGEIETLANLPSRMWTLDFPRNRYIIGLPFAVGGERGPGKVLVLADHSIFINEMMLPQDNGNVEFTYNCLDWLRGKADGRRTKVLFVEDGRVRTDFDVPLKSVPIDPAQLPGLLYANRNELAVGVEQELVRLENRNAHNEGLMGFLSDRGLTPDLLEQYAVVLFSVLLVGYAGYRLLSRGRHRAEPAVLPLVRAVALHVPAAPLLEQRRQALVRGGNVWEAARGLARQWFASAGGPSPPPRPPRVVVEGGRWEQWMMRRRVRRLWRLAYDPSPVRVSLRALRRLFGELEELSVALANGSLRLEA